MHPFCLGQWLANAANPTCPVCRTPVSQDIEESLGNGLDILVSELNIRDDNPDALAAAIYPTDLALPSNFKSAVQDIIDTCTANQNEDNEDD